MEARSVRVRLRRCGLLMSRNTSCCWFDRCMHACMKKQACTLKESAAAQAQHTRLPCHDVGRSRRKKRMVTEVIFNLSSLKSCMHEPATVDVDMTRRNLTIHQAINTRENELDFCVLSIAPHLPRHPPRHHRTLVRAGGRFPCSEETQMVSHHVKDCMSNG